MTKFVNTTKIKPVKDYYCPYCGKFYSDSNWTFDHIIPLGLGGPKKINVIACFDCNHKISKMEQLAIQAPSISSRIIELNMQGYRICGRRKIESRPFLKSSGLAAGRLVKFYHNSGDQHLSLVFYGKPSGMTDEESAQLIKNCNVARMIFEKDTDEEGLAFISLVNKIFLGMGFLLWGVSFAQSNFGEHLRKNVWSIKKDDIQDIDESDHHAIWRITDDEDLQYSEDMQIDALDNTPDTTICFSKSENIYFGLVNILGKLESSIRLGNIDRPDLFDDYDKGVVIIASSIKNQMEKMTLKEYEKYKADQFEKEKNLSK
jgi:hypothetical protein